MVGVVGVVVGVDEKDADDDRVRGEIRVVLAAATRVAVVLLVVADQNTADRIVVGVTGGLGVLVVGVCVV